ncbi:MAG: 30S ribosomal protein S3 [Candidatus Bathyarchaeota archaeon]|nr:30S ribosomal protein S3 [Candidatus Bathyarchaeota archaeon]
MSSIRHFIEESVKKTRVDEFLLSEFERAGYGGVDITKTPLGTNIVLYAMRPGIIIGRGGVTIKNLARVLEEKFGLPNPQISVAEIEVPELNAHVVASRIASTLKRGIHFRRAGFWALNRVMESGALGAEIIISGKLRTERSRSEKFRDGYVPKSGEPAMKHVRKAVVHAQLKPGILGIKVSIMPPNVEFPDQVEILEPETEEKPEPEHAEEIAKEIVGEIAEEEHVEELVEEASETPEEKPEGATEEAPEVEAESGEKEAEA